MGFTEIFNNVILLLGLALTIYGLVIWIGQKAEYTLDYNVQKVKEEDIKKFTMAYGLAYSLMGIIVALLGFSQIYFEGKYSTVVYISYFIAYFIFMFTTKKISKKFTGANKK